MLIYTISLQHKFPSKNHLRLNKIRRIPTFPSLIFYSVNNQSINLNQNHNKNSIQPPYKKPGSDTTCLTSPTEMPMSELEQHGCLKKATTRDNKSIHQSSLLWESLARCLSSALFHRTISWQREKSVLTKIMIEITRRGPDHSTDRNTPCGSK